MKKTVIFAVIIAAASANASLFDMKFVGTGAGQGVGIVFNGSNKNVFAGKLNFKKMPSGPTFSSVCADLGNLITNGQTYGVNSKLSTADSAAVKKAGNIVAANFTSANSNENAAALQVAVWEALYDGASAPSFSSGSFKANLSTSVRAKATAYYNSITTPGTALYLKTTQNNCGQSQLTAVPEPAALASLGLGLALVVRRKTRKS